MKDPYYVALQRALIASVIVTGGTVGSLIGTGASTSSIMSALIVGICLQLGVRFLGEGTYDSNKKAQRENDLVIKDIGREPVIDAPPRPVDFDEDYHFASDNRNRHRGRLASDCAICLREPI